VLSCRDATGAREPVIEITAKVAGMINYGVKKTAQKLR